MANVMLVVKVTEIDGVETYKMRHQLTDIQMAAGHVGEFLAPAGEKTRLKWWMIGNPGGSMKVEVFQGEQVIATRLKSQIPLSKPAGFDWIFVKPE